MMPKEVKTKRTNQQQLMCNCLMNFSQNKTRCKYPKFSINCLFWLFFSWVGNKNKIIYEGKKKLRFFCVVFFHSAHATKWKIYSEIQLKSLVTSMKKKPSHTVNKLNSCKSMPKNVNINRCGGITCLFMHNIAPTFLFQVN